MIKKHGVFWVLLGLLVILWGGCSRENTKSTSMNRMDRILVVYSSDLNQPWSRQVESATRHFLKVKDLTIKELELNIFPDTSFPDREKAGAKAMQEVESFKPGIVLAVEDPAQEYFAKKLAGSEKLNIVFCGVDEDIIKYNYPNFNVTGILIHPKLQKLLDLYKQVAPEVSSFTVLADASERSDRLVSYIEGIDVSADLRIVRAPDFSSWQEVILNPGSEAVILLGYGNVQGVEGTDELLTWTIENVPVPALAFDEEAVRKGALLGIGPSGFEHGSLASIYVSWISGGKQVIKIPISTGNEGQPFLNVTTAKRLGIDISGLDINMLFE